MGDGRDDRTARLGFQRGADLSFVAKLWAAPASVAGIVLSPFFDDHYIVRGVLLCEGARWPRRLGWKYRAITFGHVVLAVDDLDPEIMNHEMVHVGQYERWGVLFFPAYVASGIAAKARGGSFYRDNHFECQARGEPGKMLGVDPQH